MQDENQPTSSRPTALAPNEVRLTPSARHFGPQLIIGSVRRRFRLFLAVLLCVSVLAVGASLLQPRRYTAMAEVLLDASGATERLAGSGNRVAREVQILRSHDMASAVATALQLDPGALEDSGPLTFISGNGASASPSERRVVDRLINRLVVTPMTDTYALTIAYTAPEAAVAARVANEYARQYVAGRLAGMEAAASPLDRPFARIISNAEAPLRASSPHPLLALLLGATAGLLLGTLAAVLIERRAAAITSGRDIAERLGLPHLGSVPTLKSVLPDATSPLDSIVTAPTSGFAEAFRGLMMSIRLAGGRGTQLIAISSALPNEGKTTIAACLARSIALSGETVVLIDADARRRDTSALFGLSARHPGLLEVLRYEATLDEALVRDQASGAWILPLTGADLEGSDLLGGPAMEALLEDLRRRFKRVLIDTAPLLAISTTRAIAAFTDVLVLVVRWRGTADHAVLTALKLLPVQHVRIAGAVLSQVDIASQVKLGHGDPTFYYHQYSKYYNT